MTSRQEGGGTPKEGGAPAGVRKRSCPPVRVGDRETVCCPPIQGVPAACCKPRRTPQEVPPQGVPPEEAPPGEGPADHLPPLPDDETMAELKEAYENIHGEPFNNSLLKKYLSRATFDDLKYKKTKEGNTLLDTIRSGAKCPDSVVGVYVPDGDAYNRYSRLIDPIIWDYHEGFRPSDQHPPSHWGKPNSLSNLDTYEGNILAVRVSVRRNIQGIPLMQKMTEEKFRALEQQAVVAFGKLDGEYQGDYEPVSGMSDSYTKELAKNHLIFDSYDPHLEAAKATEFSKSRGVYMNNDKTFLVWVGVEDHLEIISLQKGGNLREAYARLVGGVRRLDTSLNYQTHPRLGYVTMCPSNLGNTVKATVLISLPYSGYDDDIVKRNAEDLKLETSGEKKLSEEDEACDYEISNKRKVGVTEFESVKELGDGVKEMMRLEKEEEQKSDKSPEEMRAEHGKVQKAKEEEKEKAVHQRFARREPDGQYREHEDPRDGSKPKKEKEIGKKDKAKDEEDKKDRDSDKEDEKDKVKDKGKGKEKDKKKEKPKGGAAVVHKDKGGRGEKDDEPETHGNKMRQGDESKQMGDDRRSGMKGTKDERPVGFGDKSDGDEKKQDEDEKDKEKRKDKHEPKVIGKPEDKKDKLDAKKKDQSEDKKGKDDKMKDQPDKKKDTTDDDKTDTEGLTGPTLLIHEDNPLTEDDEKMDGDNTKKKDEPDDKKDQLDNKKKGLPVDKKKDKLDGKKKDKLDAKKKDKSDAKKKNKLDAKKKDQPDDKKKDQPDDKKKDQPDDEKKDQPDDKKKDPFGGEVKDQPDKKKDQPDKKKAAFGGEMKDQPDKKKDPSGDKMKDQPDKKKAAFGGEMKDQPDKKKDGEKSNTQVDDKKKDNTDDDKTDTEGLSGPTLLMNEDNPLMEDDEKMDGDNAKKEGDNTKKKGDEKKKKKKKGICKRK